ncbi:cathepsin K isoform X1, partial [Astyanax mexicanus]
SGRSYESEEEESQRKMVWLSNRKLVLEHNVLADQGLKSYRLGMNLFADMAIYCPFLCCSLVIDSSEGNEHFVSIDSVCINVFLLGKKYHLMEEESKRKMNWMTNRKLVLEHNMLADQGLKTYRLGMNHFADMCLSCVNVCLLGKSYDSEEEESQRKMIWMTNLKLVLEHNMLADQGLKTYRLGMNHFADMVRTKTQFHFTPWPYHLPLPLLSECNSSPLNRVKGEGVKSFL